MYMCTSHSFVRKRLVRGAMKCEDDRDVPRCPWKMLRDMSPEDSEAERVVQALNGKLDDRVAAARSLKNAVVGNPTNKRRYVALEAVMRLRKCLEEVDLCPELAAQAVAALGSLSYFLSCDDLNSITPALLRCLFSSEPEPVIATARALKLITSVKAFTPSSLSSILATENVAARVVFLLNTSEESIAEVCAIIVAHVCTGKAKVDVFERVLVVPALVQLLWRTNHERCIVACLDAFSALSRHSHSISMCLVHEHGLISLSIPLTRSMDHKLRLSASRLLATFKSADLLEPGLDTTVCVALVNLLVNPDHNIQTTAALTLSELVTTSMRLQKVANEAGVILKLAAIIFAVLRPDSSSESCETYTDTSPSCVNIGERQKGSKFLCASAFIALAAVSSEFDMARDTILSYNLLPFILRGLSQNDLEIILAALKCVQALGRSVKIVRRDLSSERIGNALLSLLSSQNQEVRRSASATLCNLVLEFSPLRTVVLNKGGPKLLIKMLRSDDGELRANALWSLKNILFKADCDTRRTVMALLGYAHLQKLCRDMQPRVRELAMTIVRNLASSRSVGVKNAEVDALFAASGERFLAILSEALTTDTANLNIAVQALYVVCNIAAGTEHHKEYLMKSDIPKLILKWTSHDDERARIAAVWCTINLSWKEGRETSHRGTDVTGCLSRDIHSTTGRLHGFRTPSSTNSMESNGIEESTFSERDAAMADIRLVRISPERHRQTQGARKVSQTDITNKFKSDVSGNASCSVIHRMSNPKSGYKWRIERLRELGFEGRLRILVNDPHVEVQGRARAALELLGCEDVHPLHYESKGLLESDAVHMGRSPSPQSTAVLLRGPDSEGSLAGSP